MEKNWECLEQVVAQHGGNPKISTCDNEISHAEISGFQPSCGTTCFKHFQKNFIASICDVKAFRTFHDFLTPFVFYIFLNQISRNLVAMSRSRDGGVFASVPGYGVEIPSEE
jgi:hypothetical protein